jgi:hypothetical protein
MNKYIEHYSKVGLGAWTAKALYDDAVTGILTQNFDNFEKFLANFPVICGDFGGEAASKKIERAGNLLLKYGKRQELAEKCYKLAKNVLNKPITPPCILLEEVESKYNSRDIIQSRLDEICKFLQCSNTDLENALHLEIEADTIPFDWAKQIPNLYTRGYEEWFCEIAIKHLQKFLPKRLNQYNSPQLKVIDWSSDVWRCWRFLDCPTLIDPGIFKPSQFFVWHIVHDSVHIWQMQAYGNQWSNILSPHEFLFLEASAMCVERLILDLIQKSIVNLPIWYPASKKAIVLRLLIGLLEREIRLDLDLKVHLHGQGFTEWLAEISQITKLSPQYFQGLTPELLGMPGFCAAYTVVTDYFEKMSDAERETMLNNFPNITYESIGAIDIVKT